MLVHAVPGKPLAAVLIDGGPREKSASVLDSLAKGLGHAARIGLLSGMDLEARLWLDLVAAWPTLAEQPLAIVLTHLTVQPYGDGHRLDEVRLAVLLHTKGENERIMGAIQQFLNRYTNTRVCRVEPVESGPPGRFRLVDRRLPKWAVIDWGPVGEFYVIGIGEAVFDEAARSLADESCSADSGGRLESAWVALNGEDAVAFWLIDFEALRSSLQPAAEDIPARVLQSINVNQFDHAAWSLYRQGQAVNLESLYFRGNQAQRITIADPATPREQAEGLIPEEAETYTLIRWDPKAQVLQARDAYLRARSPSNVRKLKRNISHFEDQLDVSLERDLLDQLGPRLLFHSYPRHPLSLGSLRTIQIEIAGSAALVRSTLDKLFTRWQQQWVLRGPDSEGVLSFSCPLLHKADDGVWYLQFGLYGPAAAVCGEWIVISVSPLAVRKNLERIGAVHKGPSSGNTR